MSDVSTETAATEPTMAFSRRQSRRALLKGATAAGLAVAAGAGLVAAPSAGAQTGNTEAIRAILTVARTAEQLAITFYRTGLENARQLRLRRIDRENLRAALIEEQIHQQFFAAAGGESLADTFSFPSGAETFEDLETFIRTQQQLEGVFDSAFLAAIKEFAQLGAPRLAQIAGQIACIESEHRALGRQILAERGDERFIPADNWAYAPVLVVRVADAPALVAQAGYLSPTAGNSYRYQPVSTEDPRIEFRTPFTVSGD